MKHFDKFRDDRRCSIEKHHKMRSTGTLDASSANETAKSTEVKSEITCSPLSAVLGSDEDTIITMSVSPPNREPSPKHLIMPCRSSYGDIRHSTYDATRGKKRSDES